YFLPFYSPRLRGEAKTRAARACASAVFYSPRLRGEAKTVGLFGNVLGEFYIKAVKPCMCSFFIHSHLSALEVLRSMCSASPFPTAVLSARWSSWFRDATSPPAPLCRLHF